MVGGVEKNHFPPSLLLFLSSFFLSFFPFFSSFFLPSCLPSFLSFSLFLANPETKLASLGKGGDFNR
jgi:hypothetical protein